MSEEDREKPIEHIEFVVCLKKNYNNNNIK